MECDVDATEYRVSVLNTFAHNDFHPHWLLVGPQDLKRLKNKTI